MVKAWIRSLPFLFVPAVLLTWIITQDQYPARWYMEDPAALVKLPLGTAMMATIGIALWYCNGAVTLFAAALTDGKVRNSLLLIGFFSIWLGVDDMYMLHEDRFPDLVSQDKTPRLIVEVSMFFCYAAFTAAWLFVNRLRLSKLEWSFVVAALIGLVSSLGLDLARGLQLFDPWSPMVKDRDFAIWAEDAPKIMGIFFWTLFLWHYSKSSVLAAMEARTNAS